MEIRRRRAARSTRDQRERWKLDPTIFATECFRNGDGSALVPWSRQAELLTAVAQHDRVCCRSGHKVAKSCSAVIAAVWFAATRPMARVIVTAPKMQQVNEIFWHELVYRWLHRNTNALRGKCSEQAGSGLELDNGSQVIGLVGGKPEKLAGYSGEHLMFVIDEASGYPRALFDAIMGNTAGGAKVLMIGNPTLVTGPFYDAFHSSATARRPGDLGWRKIQISSEESPNVIEGRIVVPGLATRGWLEERKPDWGWPTGPMWQARVLGEFPTGSDDTVVGLQAVTDAIARWLEVADAKDGEPLEVTTARLVKRLQASNSRLELGVDVARFGSDRTVVFPKRGQFVLPPKIFVGQDTVGTASRILEASRAELKAGRQRAIARVDDAGVGGGVVDVLMRHEDEVEVVAVNGASQSDDPNEFFNLRSQLVFGVAEFLAEGGAIPPVAGLERELLEARYGFDARGRRKVEGKAEIKKRAQKSPDLADALALAACTRSGGERIHSHTPVEFETMAIG